MIAGIAPTIPTLAAAEEPFPPSRCQVSLQKDLTHPTATATRILTAGTKFSNQSVRLQAVCVATPFRPGGESSLITEVCSV